MKKINIMQQVLNSFEENQPQLFKSDNELHNLIKENNIKKKLRDKKENTLKINSNLPLNNLVLKQQNNTNTKSTQLEVTKIFNEPIQNFDILTNEQNNINSLILSTNNFDRISNINGHHSPNIKVIGIGGAGNNIVEHICNSKKTNFDKKTNVNFYQLNTDSQHLSMLNSNAKKYLIKSSITNGMGTGGNPELGRQATIDFEDEIKKIISNADICILVAGLGKGTGTGGIPVIAKLASEMKILTLAFVTIPSQNEGEKAMNKAVSGLNQLKEYADAITTINNEKNFSSSLFDQKSFLNVYDQLNLEIGKTIKSITDIILEPCVQNIDLADVKNFFARETHVKLFTALTITYNSNEIDNLEKILNRKINNYLFDQNFNKSNSVMILFNLNKQTPSSIFPTTINVLKKITGNKNLDVVYGVKKHNDDNIILNILAIQEGINTINFNDTSNIVSTNNVMKSNNLSLIQHGILSPINDCYNVKTIRYRKRNNLLNSSLEKNNNQLTSSNKNFGFINSSAYTEMENDFDDLIETKHFDTNKISKSLSNNLLFSTSRNNKN